MSTFRLASGVLRSPVGDEEVVLNTNTGIYHLINDTGSCLIELMASGLDLEGAASALAEESGESEERVSQEAHDFVSKMMERGLIEVVSE